MKILISIVLGLVVFSSPVFAHPGHGVPGHANLVPHSVLGVEHFVPLILAVVFIFALQRGWFSAGGSDRDDEE